MQICLLSERHLFAAERACRRWKHEYDTCHQTGISVHASGSHRSAQNNDCEQIHLFQETELAFIFQSTEMYQTIQHYLIELREALRWYLECVRETSQYSGDIWKSDKLHSERS
jgi:hypothetical protein